MTAATKLDIKNSLLTNAKALGNSNRGLKELCSDLVNSGAVSKKQLCDGTFLSPATLDRMGKLTETELGDPYRPNADTCERILRYFGAELSFDQVVIKGKYKNKEKGNG